MVFLWGFFGAYLIARLSAPGFASRNRRRGHVDSPGGRKKQSQAIPYGGGTAVIVGVFATLGISLVLLVYGEPFQGGGPKVHAARSALIEGVQATWPRLATILAAALTLAITGRLDDRRGLPVSLRLALQIAAATAVVISGTRLGLYLDNPWIQGVVTVLFIVFVTNAFNFIDNMDGLALGGGVAAALGLALIAGLDNQTFVGAFAAILAGATFGVLAHNAAPARLYLGDEGSLFVGFLLGTLAVLVSYRSEQGFVTPSWFPFVVPPFVLGLPLLDGIFVCITRPLRGVSPWTAGRDHLSHRLARRLTKDRDRPDSVRAVRVLTMVAFAGPALAVFLYPIPTSTARAIALLVVGLLLATFGRRT